MTARLRTPMPAAAADDLIRRRVGGALRAAEVEGVIPTPLAAIAKVADIAETLDIREFNQVHREAHRRRRAPGVVLKRFMGAVFFQSRIVLVDTTKPESMRRWTEAHELAHRLCPWHELNTYLDDDETLSPQTKQDQEVEANTGAAHLLFQGAPFWERALDFRLGIGVPIAMADDFSTSITATLRYYVETHPDPVALICASGSVQNRARRVVYTVESPTFGARFGAASGQLPGGILPTHAEGPLSYLADAGRVATTERLVGRADLAGVDLRGEPVTFDVETFFNGYNLFVLLQPRRRLQLGRRLDVRHD